MKSEMVFRDRIHYSTAAHRMMRRGPGPVPVPPGHGLPIPPGPGQVSNITNSNDFASKDSRVFVGNLNTFALSKEDVDNIFRRYGIVSGISMHKGYAFVQFNHPGEARKAVGFENAQVYAGQQLGKSLFIDLISFYINWSLTYWVICLQVAVIWLWAFKTVNTQESDSE